jgi:hypothetical protein
VEPYFRPFVGDNYWSPTKFRGRLLVLGESHYVAPADIRPDFTEDLLKRVSVDPSMPGFRTRYYRNLFYVLAGKRARDVQQSEWEPVWDSLAFYNFAQTTRLTRPLMRPTKQEWLDSLSPFRTVLSNLRPEFVVITGHTLTGYVLKIEGIKKSAEGGVWIPTTEGAYAFARCILHPSSRSFLSRREEQRRLIAEMLERDWPLPKLLLQ